MVIEISTDTTFLEENPEVTKMEDRDSGKVYVSGISNPGKTEDSIVLIFRIPKNVIIRIVPKVVNILINNISNNRSHLTIES